MLKSADVRLWLTKTFKDKNLWFTAFERSAMLQGDVLFLGGVLAGLSDAFTGSIHTHWTSLRKRSSPNHIILMVKKLLHSTHLKAVFAFHLLSYPLTDNYKQMLSFLLHFVSLTNKQGLREGFQCIVWAIMPWKHIGERWAELPT